MNEILEKNTYKTQKVKKMTKQRLKNIALYYLKRFDSSSANLRQVLQRRTKDSIYHNPDLSQEECFGWIEELLLDFERLGYLNDKRYAEFKIKNYLLSGKPEKYIKIKMGQKGISQDLIDDILSEQEYDLEEMALKYAKKKKIGPYRVDKESQKANYQKDLGSFIRAGFDYEIVLSIMGQGIEDDF